MTLLASTRVFHKKKVHLLFIFVILDVLFVDLFWINSSHKDAL